MVSRSHDTPKERACIMIDKIAAAPSPAERTCVAAAASQNAWRKGWQGNSKSFKELRPFSSWKHLRAGGSITHNTRRLAWRFCRFSCKNKPDLLQLEGLVRRRRLDDALRHQLHGLDSTKICISCSRRMKCHWHLKNQHIEQRHEKVLSFAACCM